MERRLPEKMTGSCGMIVMEDLSLVRGTPAMLTPSAVRCEKYEIQSEESYQY